ncbi:hypothetical protein NQ318_000489 [Aromia moschata]|uniref:Uncharacterized protein n=1 Tax=Aromia moschata TaxID=1265417 RepID=A0AAV8YF25_9CUCU|nr:hypothetical protein NQ318_000489 [Aromia moschata]
MDSDRILKVESNSSFVLGAIVPSVEVTFVMPSQCPGKESSGGDVESFVPDSSSIADDVLVGSAATVWQHSTLSITQAENAKKPVANGSDTEQNSMKLNSKLSADNEELKRRLQAFERVSEENRSLRKAKEETDVLRTCLKTSQDEVVRLLDEKQKLLDEIKRLQDQLNGDRGWQWNSSKR